MFINKISGIGFNNNFWTAQETLQVWIPDKDISDVNQQPLRCSLTLIYTHVSHYIILKYFVFYTKIFFKIDFLY